MGQGGPNARRHLPSPISSVPLSGIASPLSMPTRIECPLYPSPRDVILVAALTLRLIQVAYSPKTLTLGAITAFSCRMTSRAFTPLGPDTEGGFAAS